MASSQI